MNLLITGVVLCSVFLASQARAAPISSNYRRVPIDCSASWNNCNECRLDGDSCCRTSNCHRNHRCVLGWERGIYSYSCEYYHQPVPNERKWNFQVRKGGCRSSSDNYNTCNHCRLESQTCSSDKSCSRGLVCELRITGVYSDCTCKERVAEEEGGTIDPEYPGGISLLEQDREWRKMHGPIKVKNANWEPTDDDGKES